MSELERRCGQPLEISYREFLATTNGMEHFYLDLSAFGTRDWPAGERVVDAIDFGETLREIALTQDVGLPQSVDMFPVAIDEDSTVGIFMINVEGVGERFWWVGNGDSMFFNGFLDILSYTLDPSSIEPRSEV
ncbi:hypothetical protein [Streptomyces sp. NPDC048340]|uniref:hypothetical protein n=1 Tax=Streptomyces sp. NPDC048340 TaxID=3365537 RepID=UPI0037164AC5